MTDQLISRLRAGEKSAWHKIFYRYRSHFISWAVYVFGITEPEAKDAYQETMMVFYEMVRHKKIINLTGDLTTLLFDIGKKRILISLKEKSTLNKCCRILSWDNDQEDDLPLSFAGTDKIKQSLLKKCLNSLSEHNRKFILMCFNKNFDMNDIAKKFGLKNADIARHKKHKIMKTLMLLMRHYLKEWDGAIDIDL